MIPESVSVADLAREWEICSDTVLQMIRDGRLRGVRVGRTYRIPTAAVAEFLAGSSKPEPEPETEPALHPTVVGISPQTAARWRKRAAS